MTDTTHLPGSPQDSRPAVPATADGAGRLSAEVITCLICAWEFGTVNGLWDHTRMHMLTPALYGQLSDTAKLRADVTRLEGERNAAVFEAGIWEADAAFALKRAEQAEAALATAERERDDARQRNVDLARVHADHERSWQVERSETADDVMALIPRLKQAEAQLAASESRARALREALIHRCACARIDPECEDCQQIIALIDYEALAAADDGPGAAPSGEGQG